MTQCNINELTPNFQLLLPDFDIIQAIHELIPKLPIKVDIVHVRAHQDWDKPYDKLTPFAQLNILANHYAEQLHNQTPSSIGLFPTCLPRNTAALFHGVSPITSDIPNYIRQGTHKPPKHEYLFECSKTATGRDSPWMNAMFNNITWRPLGEAL